MSIKKMDYIERISDNILTVNDIIIVNRDGHYSVKDKYESLSESVRNVWKCPKMSENVQKFPKMLESVRSQLSPGTVS